MVSSVKNIIKGFRRNYVGIQLTLVSELDMVELSIVVAQVNSGSLEIITSACGSSLEIINDYVKSDDIVSIGIEGKGVISKLLPGEASQNPLLSLMPTASSEEFYQNETRFENKVLYSSARRSTIDVIISKLNALGIFPINTSLGIGHIERIIPLFQDSEEICLPGYYIKIKNKGIDSFTKSENEIITYTIEEDDIESRYLLPLGLIMDYRFFDSKNGTNYPSFLFQRQQYKYRRLSKNVLISFLVTLIISLLLNFLIYSNLSTKEKTLVANLQNSSEFLAEFEKLNVEIQNKEKILELHNKGKTHFSFYGDRIASCLEDGLTLKKLSLSPIINSNSNAINNRLETYSKQIFVQGKCQKSSQLSKWLIRLNQFEWIESVTIINYIQDQGTKLSDFELEILIDENY